ncbi:MAG TPA: DUF6285 domain-containing protein, partial [Acidimicrobiales bacterium]|nr:DUF6285 domain-containing protein [Acidimicrobiales bacterium]
GGSTSSVELATIGRRVFECEWDLLGLLALADPLYTAGPLGEPAPGGELTPAASDLHGTTTVHVLVEAVRDLLAGPVMEGTAGSVRHQARVAANALGIVARELELGPHQEVAHQQRLAELGVRSDLELAATIRGGSAAVGPTLVRVLAADARDRLLVANPGWLSG